MANVMQDEQRRQLANALISIGEYAKAAEILSGKTQIGSGINTQIPSMPSTPQIPNDVGGPDPQGGTIEGPPTTAMGVKKPQSKLASLLPLLVSGGFGALAGKGMGGAVAGLAGYSRGQQQEKENKIRQQAVDQSQMNQVLQRIQEQQRLQNEQRRLKQADLKEVYGEIDKVAKGLDLEKPGAIPGLKQYGLTRGSAQGLDQQDMKSIEDYVDNLGKTYQPEQKYVVGESGVPSPFNKNASADVPGAPDVSMQQMGVQGVPLQAANDISMRQQTKRGQELEQQRLNKEATVHYQNDEIVDAKAPGGHRSVLFDPIKGQYVDPETRQVIKGAQKYQQPNWAGSQMHDPLMVSSRETIAQSIAKGDLAKISEIANRQDKELIYARVLELNPKMNASLINRMIRMEDDRWSSKPASIGGQLQSYGTFLEHAGEAKEALNHIYQSNTPAFNKPLNWWKRNAQGDPNYQAYIASLEPVRKEFEGFLLGGRALYGEDRKSAEILLSDDASPAQQHAALKQLAKTAQARFNEINHRYKGLMGKDIEDAFSPQALEAMQKLGVVMKNQNAGPTGYEHLSDEELMKGILTPPK
jgi:hypothetical protein